MAIRFLVAAAAAAALCALLATAAAKPVSASLPATFQCDGNMSALAAGLTSATNTALAKHYGQGNTTTTVKKFSFNVPKICSPFGTCGGGKTYAASLGKTMTRGGATDVSSDWTVTSCYDSVQAPGATRDNPVWFLEGNMVVVLTWLSSIEAGMVFSVTNFLGVDLPDITLSATINGLAANVPGTWTVATIDGATGTIEALNFASCTVTSASVDLDLNGQTFTNAASTVQAKINGYGSDLCNTLNKKLLPRLVGRSIRL